MTYPTAQQPAWQPPAERPPLSPRSKKGAAIAGAVGFVLLSLGFALFGLPLALLAFGAFFTAIVRLIGRVNDKPDADLLRLREFIDQFQPEQWVVPMLLVALLGLAIMAAALFISSGILRSHGVNKPWQITWAGAGIAIVGSWLVSGVLSVILQLFSFGFGFGREDNWGAAIAVGVISLVVNLAASAIVGWLSWWWMTHLMRPATATAPATEVPLTP